MRANPFEKRLKPEQRTQKSVVEFLNWYAPTKKIFFFHTNNEYFKTPFNQYLWGIMGSKESVSDLLFISRSADKKYNGLALELKADGVKVWKKNGECYFPKQEEFLKKCREQGWRGEFAVGKDEAIKIIKEYFETK